MKVEEYLDKLGGQIRDKHARQFVADEVRGHIEDQADFFEKEGMSREEALSEAVKEMGDPVSVGIELDKIHRPHMEWGFLGYVMFISFLSLAVQYLINRGISNETDAGIIGAPGWGYPLKITAGLAAMLLIYRLDYTVLVGKGSLIGGLHLSMITVLSLLFGEQINGRVISIRLSGLRISEFVLLLLYIPIFAAILHEYRGKGRPAVVKILFWITAPIVCQFVIGYRSLPIMIFLLISEMVLFFLALNKNWYVVNKKRVRLWISGMLLIALAVGLAVVWRFHDYQRARIEKWIGQYGFGNYSGAGNQGINYVNSRLSAVFTHSNFIRKSDEAVEIMNELKPYQKDESVLAAIAANYGLIGAAAMVLCLFVLCVYIFRISREQKNSLGYIIGCSSAVVIGLECISNVLIISGILPFTTSILPFFSDGAWVLLANYVLLGLILSIYRYKDMRQERAIEE